MELKIELDDSVERALRERADRHGMTIEGYLQTVAEALAAKERSPRGIHGALHRLRRRSPIDREAAQVAETAARKLKADLQMEKERAIEAVGRANFLTKVAERISATIAKNELHALVAMRAGDEKTALIRFQESCVYGVNLQKTSADLEAASTEAERILSAFQIEQRRVAQRLTAFTTKAPDPDTADYFGAALTASQMELRVLAMADEETWRARFDAWRELVDGRAGAAPELTPLEVVAPLTPESFKWEEEDA